MLSPQMAFALRAQTPAIFYVTDEDDRFLEDYLTLVKKKEYRENTFVFNPALGLVPILKLIEDWSTRAHAEHQPITIHDALVKIYKDATPSDRAFYIFQDPDRWFSDAHAVRRFLNILQQIQHNHLSFKTLIFVGSRLVIPEKLSRHIEVIHDRGVSPTDMNEYVRNFLAVMTKAPVPETDKTDYGDMFKGLTLHETRRALLASYVSTKKESGVSFVDPEYIQQFRRQQFKKTDLIQYVDTPTTFNEVGGADRFKEWARKMRHAWTPAGKSFGLKPPKGVLCVGVWGCGKSLSVKSLGTAWNLPVISLEMGRLRSSGVGESEANVYKATRIIEAAAPCVLWSDEAEKSFSGAASSSQSDAGTTSRTLGIFSTWIQETQAPVCLAMTANTLKGLPVEFVNRMDERFFFDIPSETDRIDILKIHLTKAGQDPSRYNLAMLAEKAQALVGREIEQAILTAMVESFDQKRSNLDEAILASVLSSKPRILKTMGDEVAELVNWVGYDPDSDEGIRARFASKPERNSPMKVLNTNLDG